MKKSIFLMAAILASGIAFEVACADDSSNRHVFKYKRGSGACEGIICDIIPDRHGVVITSLDNFKCIIPEKVKQYNTCDGLTDRVLRIGGMPLSEIPANAFKNAGDPTYIVIDHCENLEKIDADAFKGLSHLQAIEILRCKKLKELPENLLDSVNQLEIFAVTGTALKSISPRHFEKCTSQVIRFLPGNNENINDEVSNVLIQTLAARNIDLVINRNQARWLY